MDNWPGELKRHSTLISTGLFCNQYFTQCETYPLKCDFRSSIHETRKNCFRYLKLMSPLNKWYYLKNNYLTLRWKVKVQRRSLWYTAHHLMIMHPHTKYHWPISKDKTVMVRTSFAEKKQKTKTICLPSHRRMGHGFRFLIPPFLYYPPPLFQNFHIKHSFFKIFIIIRFFFIWQYQ